VNQSAFSIPSQLAKVQSDILRQAERYERDPSSIELLAVSKKKPAAAIQEAIAAGQKSFGENYVDEAIEKIQTINDPTISWHFIGAIQSRKTADIAEHFDWAHGVDRLKIASRLSSQRSNDKPPLNVCLQINIDGEATKAGISPDEAMSLANECSSLPGIALRGLMAIPAPRDQLAEQRAVFRQLHELYETLRNVHQNMDTLSIGMSGDLEAAIAEGATIVRVGTAIFGTRE